jgi:hypothetical protein
VEAEVVDETMAFLDRAHTREEYRRHQERMAARAYGVMKNVASQQLGQAPADHQR